MPNDNSIETRVAVLEQGFADMKRNTDTHINRIIADIESEKGTRARSNDRWAADFVRLDTRIASLEKHTWIGVGIITAMQFIVPVVLHFLKK